MKRNNRKRGSALVATVWVIIALTAVVLVLGRSMIVEGLTSKQRISIAKAQAAELGVEQYLLSLVATELLSPGYIDSLPFEARELGECYFWLLKPNPADAMSPAFGIDDEAAKLDLNTATYDQLMALPYMTDELACSIIDWRDADDEVTDLDGGEDTYYMSLPVPYHCKSAPFESIDELKLVKGCTPDILYGLDLNQNGLLEQVELETENANVTPDNFARGILPFVTVHGLLASTPSAATDTSTDASGNTVQLISVTSTDQSLQQLTGYPGNPAALSVVDWAFQNSAMTSAAISNVWSQLTWTAPQNVTTGAGGGGAAGGGGTTVQEVPTIAKVNVNTATDIVLMAVGFSETEVQAILNYRDTSYDPTTKDNISWLLDLVSPETRALQVEYAVGQNVGIGAFVTGTSSVYSADIVTVSRDGRAFKRVKVVIDASSGAPVIAYRRDLTSAGWPLDRAIRESLRSGQGIPGSTGTGFGSTTISR
jgi:general secretion pathway protein K